MCVKWSCKLMEKGCAEGPSPFAGSLRVSLIYKSYPLLGQEGASALVESTLKNPARGIMQTGQVA